MPPIKFSTSKVLKIFLQLNTSKSTGPDSIPAIILNSCATLLVYFLLLRNLPVFCLSPKQGDKPDPSIYRPISVISLIFKTMETSITRQQLASHETNNLLSDHQDGFRQARSTCELLAYAVHAWSSAPEPYG